jgi:hypothetical protein
MVIAEVNLVVVNLCRCVFPPPARFVELLPELLIKRHTNWFEEESRLKLSQFLSNIVTILFHRWNSVVTQLSYNGKDMDFEINGVHMLVVDNHEFYE